MKIHGEIDWDLPKGEIRTVVSVVVPITNVRREIEVSRVPRPHLRAESYVRTGHPFREVCPMRRTARPNSHITFHPSARARDLSVTLGQSRRQMSSAVGGLAASFGSIARARPT